MDKKVEFLVEEFNEIMKKSTRFFYISVGKEFQQDTIKRLTVFKVKVNVAKTEMIEIKDEKSANALLSLKSIIEALISELEMWVALKEDNPHKAWNLLINAQSKVRTATQASNVVPNLEKHAEKLHLLEKLLFPPQLYHSLCFVIESEKCSICGKEYGECDHIAGRAYMGKICYRKAVKIKDVKEVSIVKNPADKHARIFMIMVNGVARDALTWKAVGELGAKVEEY